MDAGGHRLPGDTGEGAADLGRLEPAIVRQEDTLRYRIGADLLLLQHPLDVGPRPSVEDVAGEEVAHVVADCFVGLVATLRSERHGDLVGDPCKGIPAKLERLHELGLGAVELVRRVESLDAVEQALGRVAVGRHLGLEVELAQVARILEPVEEVRRQLPRLLRDRAEVADVVLETAFLAGVEAAADAEQQQDQDEEPDAEGDAPASHDLPLLIGRGAPRRAATGRERFVLFEECQRCPLGGRRRRSVPRAFCGQSMKPAAEVIATPACRQERHRRRRRGIGWWVSW
jgi:hypothetical protein